MCCPLCHFTHSLLQPLSSRYLVGWRVFLLIFCAVPQTLGRASIGLSGPSCATRMTGGAGLRSLKHVFDAFSMGLWWHFRLRQLLWVEFMHCKYCSNLHPSFADTSPGDSWTWKRLVAIQGVAEQHIYWVLARGNVSF